MATTSAMDVDTTSASGPTVPAAPAVRWHLAQVLSCNPDDVAAAGVAVAGGDSMDTDADVAPAELPAAYRRHGL